MRYITPEEVMQHRFDGGRKPDWRAAVLCFRDRSGSETLVRELGAQPLGYKVLWGIDEDLTYQVATSGRHVGVIARCEWGGPQTAVLVEELAHLGVRTIIGLGMAGSIVAALPKRSLVIAGSALVTDGTSRYYTDAPAVLPDQELLGIASEAARRLSLPFRQARVATVDAIYRETDALVAALAREGAEMLTMETTTLYAASAACGTRSIWIGHISDCLAGNRWDDWWDPRVEEPAAATARLALSVLEGI
jgi:uridine phosphorylase